MTQLKINLKGKSLAKRKQAPKISFLKRVQYWPLMFLYKFLECLSNISYILLARFFTRKGKHYLTDHWQLIEEYFQLLRKNDSVLDQELSEENDLYEYYSDYANILEISGHAEVRVLQLTQSQVARRQRLFSALSNHHRTRYNRFLHDRNMGKMRIRMYLIKMSNG